MAVYTDIDIIIIVWPKGKFWPTSNVLYVFTNLSDRKDVAHGQFFKAIFGRTLS